MSKAKTPLKKKCALAMMRLRTQKQKKRIDLHDKFLQKLIQILDGIAIHPQKGVVLTANKKRQIAELKKIEQLLSKTPRA